MMDHASKKRKSNECGPGGTGDGGDLHPGECDTWANLDAMGFCLYLVCGGEHATGGVYGLLSGGDDLRKARDKDGLRLQVRNEE